MKNLNSKRIDVMNNRIISFVLPLLLLCNSAAAQKLTSDISYVQNGHKRQVLDIYTPEGPADKPLPVMFWIHGGGWQVGDKTDVALKPRVLTERGFVFVSTNYRLLPEVKMEELIGDVARDKGIPPFLLLYFPGNPDTQAHALRLESVLKEADIPAKAYGKRDSNHSRLNNDLGKSDDPVTQEFYQFLGENQ